METVSQVATGPESESRAERFLTALGMLAIGALCAIITVIFLSRWLYHPFIPDDVLIVRELMVAVILLPLASVTANRLHIAVTVFTDGKPDKTRLILSRFGNAIGLVFVGLLLLAGARSMLGAIETGEYYDGDIYIPVWIGYSVYVLGLAAFFLRLLVSVIRPGADQGTLEM
jgi:TRAP-type C4-dicarboxylate transport system permease small subunit